MPGKLIFYIQMHCTTVFVSYKLFLKTPNLNNCYHTAQNLRILIKYNVNNNY